MGIADRIASSNPARLKVASNKFKSLEPSIYEVWQDLHEFYYACSIFGAYLEGATSEQSARMGAMENASKNANEMYDKLELIYNRARQAKITTELCEIISGASAV